MVEHTFHNRMVVSSILSLANSSTPAQSSGSRQSARAGRPARVIGGRALLLLVAPLFTCGDAAGSPQYFLLGYTQTGPARMCSFYAVKTKGMAAAVLK